MTRWYKILGLACAAMLFTGASQVPDLDAESVEPLAHITDGVLTYRTYANQDDTLSLNILPDFSYAGYRGGGVAIPDVPVVETVYPQSGDASGVIQAAIDTVSALPQSSRGAVLLKRGVYQIHTPLRINASNVVLRGEGDGMAGTVLVARFPLDSYVLIAAGLDPEYPDRRLPHYRPINDGSETSVVSSFVPVGSRTLEVADASGFSVGDAIIVTRTPNPSWVEWIGMDLIPAPDNPWDAGNYEMSHERTITAIDGNEISVDIPFVDTIESPYTTGTVTKIAYDDLEDVNFRLEEVGVEDMLLVSSYDPSVTCYDEVNDEEYACDENHAAVAVIFDNVVNSWVRRVTTRFFGNGAVHLWGHATFTTVEDTAMLDPISKIKPDNRYSFKVDTEGGPGNLFQRCFSRGGRHSFVSQARTTGPNVWLDCLAEECHADDGPHQRWATGLAYDNVRGVAEVGESSSLKVENRWTWGSGQGWSGAQVLFWNPDYYYGFLVSETAPGAMNWVVGGQGTLVDGTFDGTCVDGIKNASGAACCSIECGTCGGPGCSSRPGGADECCTSNIYESGRLCTDNDAPCIVFPGGDGMAEGFGTYVTEAFDDYEVPRSLYIQQLEDRLGTSAVTNVTTSAQRSSDASALDALAAKASTGDWQKMEGSDPFCASGLYKTSGACCSTSCGTCGGTGCGSRPGGADECCETNIRTSGLSCLDHEPPCVIPLDCDLDDSCASPVSIYSYWTQEGLKKLVGSTWHEIDDDIPTSLLWDYSTERLWWRDSSSLRTYTPSGGWASVASAPIGAWASSGDKLYANWSTGFYSYSPSGGWKKISSVNTTAVAASNGVMYANYPDWGVYKYTSDTSYVKISNYQATELRSVDGVLYGIWGGGLYRYNGSWKQLHTTPPSFLAVTHETVWGCWPSGLWKCLNDNCSGSSGWYNEGSRCPTESGNNYNTFYTTSSSGFGMWQMVDGSSEWSRIHSTDPYRISFDH